MISVIMPTIWLGPYYASMLPKFNDHPIVGEIIIIDNDVKKINQEIVNLSKVRYVPQKENIYVNPAWNLGAKLAKFDKLCFYSDDVKFDISILDTIAEQITTSNGLFGFHKHVINLKDVEIDDDGNFWNCTTLGPIRYSSEITYNKDIIFCEIEAMHPKYAICFFAHKQSYYDIPEELKIFYGDSYLFYKNRIEGKANYEIQGADVLTFMGSSSSTFDPNTIFLEQSKAKKYIDPLIHKLYNC